MNKTELCMIADTLNEKGVSRQDATVILLNLSPTDCFEKYKRWLEKNKTASYTEMLEVAKRLRMGDEKYSRLRKIKTDILQN